MINSTDKVFLWLTSMLIGSLLLFSAGLALYLHVEQHECEGVIKACVQAGRDPVQCKELFR